jgi:DNA-binding MarR family transcriptional regulator
VSGAQKAQIHEQGDTVAVVDLTTDLLRCAQLVRSALSERLAQFGLNDVRFAAMRTLAASTVTECSQSELAERLGQSESNICTLVDRMQRDGLLSRERSSSDRRKSVLKLTAEGIDLLSKAEAEHRSLSLRMFSDLDIQQRRQLHNVVSQLNGLLDSESALQPISENKEIPKPHFAVQAVDGNRQAGINSTTSSITK